MLNKTPLYNSRVCTVELDCTLEYGVTKNGNVIMYITACLYMLKLKCPSTKYNIHNWGF